MNIPPNTTRDHGDHDDDSTYQDARNEVAITLQGAVDGEFCALDRAMLLEDPSGEKILIQPDRTVSDSDDSSQVVLFNHDQGDHIGDRIDMTRNGSGLTSLAASGIPNIVEIAAGKNSAVLVGGEMVPWLRDRVGAADSAKLGG